MSLRNVTVYLLGCLFLLTSCETDEDRLKKGREIVTTFLSNANVENAEIANSLYPDISKVGKFYKINDFKVTNASINKEKTITITGKSSFGDLLFVLKKLNGDYKITRSKGLSPSYNSNIYKYCKAIGCVNSETSDADVSFICAGKEEEFKQLVYDIKENIENNFGILNHNLSLQSIGFGTSSYLSGEVTMKNSSRFTIPSFAYNLYYQFYDVDGQLVFTEKEIGTYEPIPYGQSKTSRLFQSNAYGFDKVKAKLEIIRTGFIEDLIIENVKGNNCHSSIQLI